MPAQPDGVCDARARAGRDSDLPHRRGWRLQRPHRPDSQGHHRDRGPRGAQAGTCSRFRWRRRGPHVRAAPDHRPDHRQRRMTQKRAIVGLASLAVCGALPVSPLAADATVSQRAATPPAIKIVSPMRARIGHTLTIRGRGFSPVRERNTVVFSHKGRRAALAKPFRASRTKLLVTVPASVDPLPLPPGQHRGAHAADPACGDLPLRQAQRVPPLALGPAGRGLAS